MAAYISFQPKDFYNTTAYQATGATLNITSPGFQPDFVWIKTRNHTNSHCLFNSLQGATKVLRSNNDAVTATAADTLTSFDSTGFTLGADASGYGVNYSSSDEQISWNWKMGTTTGIDTTGSDITPTSYSFNQDAGYSVILYPGSGNDDLLPHGLGKVPQLVIIRATDTVKYWMCYSEFTGNAKEFYLNGSNAAGSSPTWNTTTPTSVNISLDPGGGNGVNTSGTNYVGYFFTSKPGCTKVGGYVGNGNADGTFVYTGFRPAFLMVKCTSHAEPWLTWDDKRIAYNVKNWRLMPNQTVVENESEEIDLLSNGFKFRGSGAHLNGSGREYVYLACAKFPIVSSNSKAGTAR